MSKDFETPEEAYQEYLRQSEIKRQQDKIKQEHEKELKAIKRREKQLQQERQNLEKKHKEAEHELYIKNLNIAEKILTLMKDQITRDHGIQKQLTQLVSKQGYNLILLDTNWGGISFSKNIVFTDLDELLHKLHEIVIIGEFAKYNGSNIVIEDGGYKDWILSFTVSWRFMFPIPYWYDTLTITLNKSQPSSSWFDFW